MDLQQQVLRTDVAGMPLEWIGYQDAVRLISLNQVSYSLGRVLYCIRGGTNAVSGLRSVIEVNAARLMLLRAAWEIDQGCFIWGTTGADGKVTRLCLLSTPRQQAAGIG